MGERARTKEERFLMALYEVSVKVGNERAALNRMDVGHALGLHDRVIEKICRDLAQINFIRKQGDDLVELTDNGIRLAKELLDD